MDQPFADPHVVIKSEAAKNLHVPLYTGLSIENILEKCRSLDELPPYLPDERDLRKLPRQWIINVVYSVIGEPFRQWVSTTIKKRNDELADKRDLMIELDPEIAKAFRSSVNISSKSSFLGVSRVTGPFLFFS